MENSLLLTCDTIRNNSLRLHPSLAQKLGIYETMERKICFGSRKLLAQVELCEGLPKNVASLSSDIMSEINIPENCRFEIQQKEDEIHIGPFIGLLAGYSHESVKNKLDNLYDYLLHYQDIKGGIIAFSIEKTNKENLTVEGYVYNPLTKCWDKGVFPYPSSIFVMTSSVSSKWMKHFKSILGNSIFNDFNYNNWEIEKLLSSSIEVKNYMPESILYQSPRELHNFLIKFRNVIVKPKNAFEKSPPLLLSKQKYELVFSSPTKGILKVVPFHKKDQAYSTYERFLRKGDSIIQAIEGSKDIRKINFRLIMVKNRQGTWQSMGMYTKKKVSISKMKKIYPVIKLEQKHLMEHLQFSNVITSMLLNEIYYIAYDALTVIEKNGVHLANAAIDISIDAKGRIQLLHIDHCCPSHEIALVSGHPELYYETLKHNMLYAKTLAGFPS